MNSLGDNLETLETAPRFIDMPELAQLRRDSGISRVSRTNSVIFLRKRERLESGDFGAYTQDFRANKELISVFPGLASPLKPGVWTQQEDVKTDVLAAFESHEAQLDNTNTLAIEAESVIDHALTIDKGELQLSESTESDAISPLPKPQPFTESKFLIKVKRTDSTLVLSGAHSELCSYDGGNDCESPLAEEIGEERTNGLVFADEPTRLRAKMAKVVAYWGQNSLLVPNVFRHIRLCEEASDAYLELQDYSRKELLVQSNGTKFKTGSCKEKSGATKKVKKVSGASVKKVRA